MSKYYFVIIIFLSVLSCEYEYPLEMGPKPDLLIQGHITSNVVLSPLDKPYRISGYVYVDSGAILTIMPGTTILAEKNKQTALIINQGGKIIASGSATAPIVFTSSAPEGSRAPSDWGGIIINGRAPLNNGNENGLRSGEGGTGLYGGNDPNDNSGALQYVRIEFAGYEYNPDKELNGLALQGVGNNTLIDHIQVHMCGDDGIEFFGGTVDAKYIIVTGAQDDGFDWTDGWTGKGQFWIHHHRKLPGSGSDYKADKGIEGNGLNNDSNYTSDHLSAPVLSNISLIGSREEMSSGLGMHIRKDSRIKMYNSIIMEFNTGINMDNSVLSKFSDGTNTIRSTVFNNLIPLSGNSAIDIILQNVVLHNVVSNNVNPIKLAGSGDYRASSTAFELGVVLEFPQDSFFEVVDFGGGMGTDPEDDWTSGWTTRNLQ